MFFSPKNLMSTGFLFLWWRTTILYSLFWVCLLYLCFRCVVMDSSFIRNYKSVQKISWFLLRRSSLSRKIFIHLRFLISNSAPLGHSFFIPKTSVNKRYIDSFQMSYTIPCSFICQSFKLYHGLVEQFLLKLNISWTWFIFKTVLTMVNLNTPFFTVENKEAEALWTFENWDWIFGNKISFNKNFIIVWCLSLSIFKEDKMAYTAYKENLG